MDPYEKTILAAHGYLELGMFRDVWRELHSLPEDFLGRADVLEILALSLMGENLWEEGRKVARRLRIEAPTEPGGYIHEAYCLHELGNTRGALDVLKSGPPSLLKKSVYFYNAGCYMARLGLVDDAIKMLEKSFELDTSLKRSARKDPDLVDLKGLL